MTARRCTPVMLLLCLLLGQASVLAHGLEHPFLGSGDEVCIQCLTSQHQYGLSPAAGLPFTPVQAGAIAWSTSESPPCPVLCGYHSRAPPFASPL